MSMGSMKRREFMKLAGGAGMVSRLLPGFSAHDVLPEETDAGSASQEIHGNTYPVEGYKRMILDYHFSEFNPATLKNANAAAIVETMTRLKVDSMLLYAKDHWGNCYFATKKFKRHKNVPQDLFGEVLEGLHKNNIKVSAYYSVGWDEYSSRNHPDWMMRDKQGQPYQLQYYKTHPYYARWTFLCINSPYGDYSLDEINEIVGKYDFESLFLDIFGKFPLCYCHYCRALWKQRYGDDVPTQLTPAETVRYLDFQENVTFRRYYEAVKQIIQAKNKTIPTTHNAGLDYELDGYIASEIDPYGVDYYRSLETKLWRARADGKEVLSIGHRTNGIFDFTLKPVPMLQWEVATGVAHNCAMMFVDQPFLDGSLDANTYSALGKAFKVADDLKPHVAGTVPYAEVLILSSEQSEALDRNNAVNVFSDPSRSAGERVDLQGAYKVFTDLHVPFDLCTDKQILKLDLHAYSLVVVPYTAYLPSEIQRRLRRYVEAGGILLFTYRTGQWDEKAKSVAEPHFGLVKLGDDFDNQISFIKPKFDLGDTYLRVSEVAQIRDGEGLDLLATLTNPGLRVTETQWVTHNVIPGADTTAPTVVKGKFGKGTFVYCNFRLFKEHWLQGLGVYRRLVEKSLEPDFKPRFQIKAPQVVETVYNRLGDTIRIVLINGITNKPAGPGNNIDMDEVVPIHGISLLVLGDVASAWNMSGKTLSHSVMADGIRCIEIPVLNQCDVVSVRMAGV